MTTVEDIKVKIEPPDEDAAEDLRKSTLGNGDVINKTLRNGVRTSANGTTVVSDSRNFTCLICDIICNNRDELRKHLKDVHSTKSYGYGDRASVYVGLTANGAPGRAFTGYMNYRYNCSVCGARFKSFRTYVTHTMSHKRSTYTSQLDDVRMAALIGGGKQYLQDYLDSDESLSGTFTCEECNTVFVQRDAYAMHKMMRAMNETCMPQKYASNTNNNNGESNVSPKEEPVAVSPENDGNVFKRGAMERCLEDVTSNVDQDEYLKSVLDKVCSPTDGKRDTLITSLEDGKLCTFCGSVFVDQDALAMHVMSDHAEEMTSGGASRTTPMTSNVTHVTSALVPSVANGFMSWVAASQALALALTCKYCNKTFTSRDGLAMHVLTHAHYEEQLNERTRNAYKRQLEVNEGSTSSKSPKLSLTGDNTDKTMSEIIREALYCKACKLNFSNMGEYNWHAKSHDTPSSTKADKEHSSKQQPDVEQKSAAETKEVPKHGRGRRNSACFGKDASLLMVHSLPRRPVSVGDCSSKTLHQLQTDQSVSTTASTKPTSPADINAVLSNVKALSSSEQKIIYSVFGKDLGLKISKPDTDNLSKLDAQQSNADSGQLTTAYDKHVPNLKEENVSSVDTAAIHAKDRDRQTPRLAAGYRDAPMCKFCDILFLNKAIYYLHMGLHNVNNPWQCNVCGKICKDAVDFAAHVIHM